MVSMKDIAKKCGVSVATVSKALNGQQDIGEATREKIAKVADEMGYLTNASARALKTNRTYNIGVLFVDERSSGLAHEYFSSVLENLKAEAESHGYDITFINRFVGGRTTTYLQHCRYRGVDGVVIASVNFEDPQVRELVESDLPVVTIDHIFNNRAAVISDNVKGMEELTRYILSKGHRKIAFIHGEQTAVTANRLTGFYRALESEGITPDEELIIDGAYHDSEKSYLITKELLAGKKEIDCILYPDDFSYLGGLRALQEAEIRIPEEISTAGYDGIPIAGIISPKLTTLRQDTKTLGRSAAAKLIELIEHPKTALLDRIIVPGKLIEGESVLDKNGSSENE
ncbi:MAG: LacI family transcriptional regulator [Lachnospiraceae bacterium]|nr:LacI family transcriptional regulator [Lachnospiraceae bacterium]